MSTKYSTEWKKDKLAWAQKHQEGWKVHYIQNGTEYSVPAPDRESAIKDAEQRRAPRLVEERDISGAYDISCTQKIIDHPKYGRLFVSEGFGGNGIEGQTYRWKHGTAIRLLPSDTFETLTDGKWNDHLSLYDAVINGYDQHERPILDFSGKKIELIAKSV